ncbi:MAG: DHHA1 domain-containing protein, partial [Planctomycetota bacterium]
LATVADMVPLIDENRVMVHFGLTSFSIGAKAERFVFHGAKGHKGLEALIHVAKLYDQGITESEIGFKLGPMMNAAGRLARAMLGIELLTTEDSDRAYALATELHQKNIERRKIEKEVFEQAKTQFLESNDWQQYFGIVVASSKWHPGVIGIVASRMVEYFHRPTLIITLQNGIGKGSGRTLGSINLYSILRQLKSHLIQVGGHAAAAGFSIQESQIVPFSKAFDKALKAHISSSDLVPQLTIDKEILLSEVDARLLKEIKWLAPFGAGNPTPVFSSSSLKVAGLPQRIGSRGEHLSFYVSHYGISHSAIAFNRGEDQERIEGKNIAIAYTPQLKQFRGKKSIQLEIKDFKILN